MDLNMEVILLEFCLDFTLRERSRCPRKIIMEKVPKLKNNILFACLCEFS